MALVGDRSRCNGEVIRQFGGIKESLPGCGVDPPKTEGIFAKPEAVTTECRSVGPVQGDASRGHSDIGDRRWLVAVKIGSHHLGRNTSGSAHFTLLLLRPNHLKTTPSGAQLTAPHRPRAWARLLDNTRFRKW